MGQGAATGITSDAAGVYWTNQTATIMRYPLPDGPPGTLTTAGGTEPFGIASDGTYAYWTDRMGGAVRRALLSGGSVETLTAPGSTTSPRSIAVRGGYVYWTEHVVNGRVMRVAADGGASQTPQVLANGSTPFELAVDDTHVYWSDVMNTTVNRADINGNGSALVIDLNYLPGGVALGEHCVYWVETNNATKAYAKQGMAP
jgi:hypothetical protein